MTISFPDGYRAATTEDAFALAELVNMAGDGMSVYLWDKMTSDGQSVWDVGQERAKREEGGFSYRNAVVREVDGQVAAVLIGYPLDEDPEAHEYADMPPMFVPMLELEELVPGTWYINFIAAYPDYRGKGYGRDLLKIAEQKARAVGSRGLSIMVADTNEVARHLYTSFGFVEQAQRPMVKEDWQHPGENWVLLLKSFDI